MKIYVGCVNTRTYLLVGVDLRILGRTEEDSGTGVSRTDQ